MSDYYEQVGRLIRERLAQSASNALRKHLLALALPIKDVEFIVTGKDRHGRPWRSCEANKKLKIALHDKSRIVILAGPQGTGKSHSAARALAKLSRVHAGEVHGESIITWLSSRFARATELVRLARFPGNDMSEYITAPILVVDDLLEEPEDYRYHLSHMLTKRDDADTGSLITIVTTNGCEGGVTKAYGERLWDRWREAGLTWVEVRERMRP